MRSVVMLSVIYAECRKQAHYAECHYAECCYAECRYAECRGAGWKGLPEKNTLTFVYPTHLLRKKFYNIGP
jgi:hypothetical protein